MGTPIKIMWTIGLLSLALIALVNCVPIDIVYTGEGCQCPTKLDYQVNIPKLPKPYKYKPNDYGYKVDVPAPSKTKVHYSFDFTVEEPKTPRPEKPSKWDLYAKVDRVAVKPKDCVPKYSSPPTRCNCGECGITKPLYRYVYNKMTPCKCKHPKCQCNLKQAYLVDGVPDRANSIRRKRDLRQSLFPFRNGEKERRARYVKLYHKELDEKPPGLFDFLDPFSKKTKRKNTKKDMLLSRIVKRDIKGEYDLIEEDRKHLDLTLPDIIQYMPETLNADFNRNQCYFGCTSCQHKQKTPIHKFSETNDDHSSIETTTKKEDKSEELKQHDIPSSSQEKKGELFYQKDEPSENAIAMASTEASTFTKRNAANYFNYGLAPINTPASAYQIKQLPLFETQTAYEAEPQRQPRYQYEELPPINLYTYPIPVQPQQQLPSQKPDSAITYGTGANILPQYGYDQKYLETNGNGRTHTTQGKASVPDPTGYDTSPLHYVGELETPQSSYRSSSGADNQDISVSSRNYPVQQISNDQLDKIITEIIYRHPDFIDATTHYDGALVDPEQWQEDDTKDFIKKLLSGRLNLWFGDNDDTQSSSYQSQPPSLYPQYTYNYGQPAQNTSPSRRPATFSILTGLL